MSRRGSRGDKDMYWFLCNDCEMQFENESVPAAKVCPHCGSEDVDATLVEPLSSMEYVLGDIPTRNGQALPDKQERAEIERRTYRPARTRTTRRK